MDLLGGGWDRYVHLQMFLLNVITLHVMICIGLNPLWEDEINECACANRILIVDWFRL